MNERYVMGIDNGSQSTKVVIFDMKGNEVAFGSCPLREPHTPTQGVVVHPDDDLWDSVHQAMKNCLGHIPDNQRKKVEAIGLCTIRSCRVLLKKDGTLAQPVISWMDDRLAEPYKHTDDRVHFVTTTSGYIGLKMTGEMNDTAGNYEVNWPLDRKTLDWSEDDAIMEKNGLKKEMLFNLVKPGEKLGSMRSELTEQLGLKKGIPVVATSNDKAVETLGAGIKDENSIMISLGTYISAMMIGDSDYKQAQNFFPTLSSIPFQYAYESSGIRRGMWTVSWFKKLLGKDLVANANQLRFSEEEYLNQKAKKIPPGSEGLITILDWLSSPDTPYRKGMMIGFDHRHTKYHIYRSILEAIAFDMKNNIDVMLSETNKHINEITVTGGGSKSDTMLHILSDVFNRPVHRKNGTSNASLGAAICACKYLAVYDSFTDAIETMIKTETTFAPDAKRHAFYNRINNNVIKHIRKSTDDILKRTYSVFQ